MERIALSIEQMKHLEELGLDTKGASMYIAPQVDSITGKNFIFPIYPNENPDWDNMIKNGFIPTYTLQDIKEFLDNNLNDCYITITYEAFELKDPATREVLKIFCTRDILKNGYYMLVWCIENEYIKTNKV